MFREVTENLALSDDKQVVLWIFDSISHLVSLALEDVARKGEYAGIISLIHDMKNQPVPVGIASSATTATNLDIGLFIFA